MNEKVGSYEQALKESEEKYQQLDLYSRERYHRIKNIMQINSSLVNLQSRFVKEKKCLEMFSDIQDRIKCMLHITDIFYQCTDFEKFEVENHIENLANDLVESHGVANKIELIFNIEKISLNIDHVTPFMQLITELINNSLKHAFPGDRKGEIIISLCSKDENNIELEISDNGVGIPSDVEFKEYGIPPNLDFKEIVSLGFFMVRMLVFELRGKIDLDRSKGTDFKIIFTKKK